MIRLRGTSHVAADDIAAIRAAVREHDPDVVAIELDRARLHGLLHGQREDRVRNPLLLFLTMLQDYLGRKTGVAPGSDMLAAFEAAKEAGIDVALIDRDIGTTLRKLRAVPLREKVKLLGFLLLAPVLLRGGPDIDLGEVPDDAVVRRMLLRFEVGFPNLYHVLVEERNEIMAERLLHLDRRYGDVLAFVGAGHVSGIRRLLPAETTT